MAKLTAKQEKYVQGLVTGLSQRKAYREAYPNSKKWKDRTVDSRASELLKESNVLGRYNGLMNEHKDKALFTREEAVNELIWLYKQSRESIEVHDEGYVRQGTSGAMLGALDRLITLELLDPVQQKQYDKLVSEVLKTQAQAEIIKSEADKLLATGKGFELLQSLVDVVNEDED